MQNGGGNRRFALEFLTTNQIFQPTLQERHKYYILKFFVLQKSILTKLNHDSIICMKYNNKTNKNEWRAE